MEVILQQQFRARLKELMELQDLSQTDLAHRMGVRPQFVSKYLAGDRCPGLDVVEKFAKALNLANPAELLSPEILQPTG